jgi:NAD(P)-dependent dehydrogenase (short-subunit alcohol dehydrogenase family)
VTRSIDHTTFLITGATDGLGRALAIRLAGSGASLLLHGRDPHRLARTAEEAERAGARSVVTFRADLASLAEVRALAEEVERSTEELHVLVSNAGIGWGRPEGNTRQESRDGYELRFAVNHLAGFLLIQLLLPLLRRSASSRVVHVASIGQEPVDFDDVMLERDYSGARAYHQSKLAQITCGFELASRLPAGEVAVNSLHPATHMPTKMVLAELGRSADSIDVGVEATVALATSSELEAVTGRFFDRSEEATAAPQAYDPAARSRLWELCLRLTGAPDAPLIGTDERRIT